MICARPLQPEPGSCQTRSKHLVLAILSLLSRGCRKSHVCLPVASSICRGSVHCQSANVVQEFAYWNGFFFSDMFAHRIWPFVIIQSFWMSKTVKFHNFLHSSNPCASILFASFGIPPIHAGSQTCCNMPSPIVCVFVCLDLKECWVQIFHVRGQQSLLSDGRYCASGRELAVPIHPSAF